MLVPRPDGNSKGNEALIRRISASFKDGTPGSFVAANTADANSVRFIQDRMDDLDVRIASREFEEAVRSIEKGIPIAYRLNLRQVDSYLALWIPSNRHTSFYQCTCHTVQSFSPTIYHTVFPWNRDCQNQLNGTPHFSFV